MLEIMMPIYKLTAHPAFMKFLADLEIYVDGKAGIQIQSLNAIVDAIRGSIINGDMSGDNAAGDTSSEDIKNLQMLDVAHIEDDAYLYNIIPSLSLLYPFISLDLILYLFISFYIINQEHSISNGLKP